MPAVVLSRIKIQASQVCEAAGEPAVFLSRLRKLFDEYADRTYRSGRQGKPAPLIPHYNVSRPVVRQVQLELERVLKLQPGLALPLADALWADENLEIRMLAVEILGLIEPQPAEPIIGRIRAWARPGEDPDLLDALLASGRTRLQEKRPDLWLDLLAAWLDDPAVPVQALGLKGLFSLVNAEGFTNLPAAIRLLDPVLKQAPQPLAVEILDVLESLARVSPGETSFFLRQVIAGECPPGLARLVRKSLAFFPTPQAAALKEALANIHMV